MFSGYICVQSVQTLWKAVSLHNGITETIGEETWNDVSLQLFSGCSA